MAAFLHHLREPGEQWAGRVGGGTLLGVASSLKSVPNKPLLVVIGSEKALRGEVLAWGGTDALIRPLREADVIRTAASAWHRWMKRFETHHTRGPRCSGA